MKKQKRNRDGFGSVYRPKGRATYSISYRNATTGARVYEHGFTSQTAADLALRKATGRIAEGETIRQEQVGRRAWTFDDAVEAYEKSLKHKKASSRSTTMTQIRLHLLPAFEGRKLSDITTGDIAQLVDDLLEHGRKNKKAKDGTRRESGLAPGSVDRLLQGLRTILKIAEDREQLHKRPKITLLKVANARKGFFEREQFDAVRPFLPPWLAAPAIAAYHTGWRMPSEIMYLEWRHIDRRLGVIKIDPGETKNGKGRLFPYGLIPELVAVIEEAYRIHGELAKAGKIVARVFHRDGRRLVQKAYGSKRTGTMQPSVYKVWHRACRAAGITGRIPHDFRRTSARNLIRADVPEPVAMVSLGHETPSIFRRYAIVNEALLREQIGKYAATPAATASQAQPSGVVLPLP